MDAFIWSSYTKHSFCFDLKKLKTWLEYLSENYKTYYSWTGFVTAEIPVSYFLGPTRRFRYQNSKNVVLCSMAGFYHIRYGSGTLHAVLCSMHDWQVSDVSGKSSNLCNDEIRQPLTPSSFDWYVTWKICVFLYIHVDCEHVTVLSLYTYAYSLFEVFQAFSYNPP